MYSSRYMSKNEKSKKEIFNSVTEIEKWVAQVIERRAKAQS